MSVTLPEQYGVLIDVVMLALNAGLVEDKEATQRALENFTAFIYNEEIHNTFFIDWSGVPLGFEWFAVDRDGRAFFYNAEPEVDETDGQWTTQGGDTILSPEAIEFYAWQESKVQRP